MLRPLLCCATLVASLSACTWVKMEPGGVDVRVAHRGDDLGGCSRLGEIGVEVQDEVALYRRNELKVRDELETMARNEATSLDADTIQALNEPSGGEQRFAAYRCGRYAAAARAPAAPEREAAQPQALEAGEVETYPVDDD